MEPAVLIVDDEPDNLRVYARFLDSVAEVRTAPSAAEALAQAEVAPPDVLVTDLRMPGRGGIDLASEVRERWPLCEVVVVTAHADVDTAISAVRIGVVEYLRKPVRRQRLQAAVVRAAERSRVLESLQRQQEREPGEGLGRLVGDGESMRRLRSAIVRIQNADVNVLILGETGTGKEVIARAIHEGSHRSGGPFVAVNCAALSPEILESELFGHEKGAYTGATAQAKGLLESANGGTFLLDEVGDCTLDLQAKLLRTLQERQVLPVGGREPRPLDIRLVAATNRDLAAEVAAGRFREDLFFRLNVFPVRSPPLRDRPEDIPALVEHFVLQFANRFGMSAGEATPELLQELAGRPWSGNVRELQNVVSRLVILGEGGPYTPETLAACEALDETTPPNVAPDASTLENLIQLPRPPSLQELEEAYVRLAMERCGGRKGDAARLLGIHRVTLNRKLEKWSEDREPSEEASR